MGEALIVRKKRDGTITVGTGTGNPIPPDFEFTPRLLANWVAQEIATVTITVETEDGPMSYEVTGALRAEPGEGQDESQTAVTGFVVALVDDPKAPKRRKKRDG